MGRYVDDIAQGRRQAPPPTEIVTGQRSPWENRPREGFTAAMGEATETSANTAIGRSVKGQVTLP